MSQYKERAVVWDETRKILKEKYLVPGMTWDEVLDKYHTDDKQRLEKQIEGYTQFEEFAWLRKRVGAGREIFDANRGQIVADTEQDKDFATYARIPHLSRTYYDAESRRGADILGKPIEIILGAADNGLEELAIDLALTVGDGKVDKGSLAFYWLCWRETAGVVVQRLKENGSLVPIGLSEYELNPELLEYAARMQKRATEKT